MRCLYKATRKNEKFIIKLPENLKLVKSITLIPTNKLLIALSYPSANPVVSCLS